MLKVNRSSGSLLLDCNELLPGLWIGSKPPRGTVLRDAGFALCVFCAEEIQAKNKNEYPGISVLNAPLDDHEPTDREKMIAVSAAKFVSNWIKKNKGRVLVTCRMGLNRSGLVSALAWKMLEPKRPVKHIIQEMRRERSSFVLGNEHFVKFLLEFDSVGPVYSYYVNPVIM
jgi:hypothetical protein